MKVRIFRLFFRTSSIISKPLALGSSKQREGAEGVLTSPPPSIEQRLTYFSNHEDDI